MTPQTSATYRQPAKLPSIARKVHLISAMTRARVIGLGSVLPWHIAEDMTHFKTMTEGKAVIMGRLTWLGIPAKFRPLRGRTNIIVSRNPAWWPEVPLQEEGPWDTVLKASSIPEAVLSAGTQEPWIIGGAGVYEGAIPHVTDLHITLIEREFSAITEALAAEARGLVTVPVIRFPVCPERDVALWELVGSKPLADGVTYNHFTRRAAAIPI